MKCDCDDAFSVVVTPRHFLANSPGVSVGWLTSRWYEGARATGIRQNPWRRAGPAVIGLRSGGERSWPFVLSRPVVFESRTVGELVALAERELRQQYLQVGRPFSVTDSDSVEIPNFTDEEIEQSYKLPADAHLQFLVEWVNGTENELGITVMTGGLMVTGRLASSHKYFVDFADLFADSLTITLTDDPDSDVNSLREQIRHSMALPGRIAQAVPPERRPAPRYIHIRNPRFRLGADLVVPALDGSKSYWWRGRLSRIDGFQLGEFGDA